MPLEYKGVIVQKVQSPTKEPESRDIDSDEQEEGKVLALRQLGSFSEVRLWGHESMAEGDDPFVKGIEEWIGFAEAVRFPKII